MIKYFLHASNESGTTNENIIFTHIIYTYTSPTYSHRDVKKKSPLSECVIFFSKQNFLNKIILIISDINCFSNRIIILNFNVYFKMATNEKKT